MCTLAVCNQQELTNENVSELLPTPPCRASNQVELTVNYWSSAGILKANCNQCEPHRWESGEDLSQGLNLMSEDWCVCACVCVCVCVCVCIRQSVYIILSSAMCVISERIISTHFLSNYRCSNKNGVMVKLRACRDYIYSHDSKDFTSTLNKHHFFSVSDLTCTSEWKETQEDPTADRQKSQTKVCQNLPEEAKILL